MSKRSRIMGAAAVATMLTGSLAQARPAKAQLQPDVTLRVDAPRPGRLLGLDEALGIAHRNNRDLAQAKARIAQAHAGVLQAWVTLLPQVALQGKYTHNYKEVKLDFGPTAAMLGLPENAIIQKQEQLDGSVTATVPLLVPSAYQALKSAQALEDASRANNDVTDATVLYTTAQTYYACAGADEVVAARKHAIVLEQKALDNAKARLDAGVVNRVEVTRAELQLVRARQAELEAEDAAAQSYRALGTIMNHREDVRVVSSEEPAAQADQLDALTEQALRLRPEFPAAQKTLVSYDLQRKSDLWKWAPTLSGFGNARVFNYAGFSGDKYSWALGLQLDWAIYDGGLRDGQRKLALAQRQEQEAKLDLLRDQVRDDVYNADRNVRTKRSALDTAKRSVQLSKETLDLVQVQHDAGTATQLDLLQAQDNLVAAEVALAQARFDLSLGALSLERLSGAFPANLNLK
ncbi:MAG TPA: TolC family protein [Polyangiaceae bacterium]|nr:TolC family protein [Polyangiaceae bacterium]